MQYKLLPLFCIMLILIAINVFGKDNIGVEMPAEVCQVSCSDEDEDTTYTVALSAKAWVDVDNDNSCGLEVYESLYENGNPIYPPTLRASLDPIAINTPSYGGYIYSSQEGDNDDEETRKSIADDSTFTRGIMSGFLGLLNDYETIWRIFYASDVQVTKSNDIIYAQYAHKINPCPVGTYVQIHAMCDAHGWDNDEAAIGCRVYNRGGLTENLNPTETEEETTLMYEPEEGYTFLGACLGESCDDECDELCLYENGGHKYQQWGTG